MFSLFVIFYLYSTALLSNSRVDVAVSSEPSLLVSWNILGDTKNIDSYMVSINSEKNLIRTEKSAIKNNNIEIKDYINLGQRYFICVYALKDKIKSAEVCSYIVSIPEG